MPKRVENLAQSLRRKLQQHANSSVTSVLSRHPKLFLSRARAAARRLLDLRCTTPVVDAKSLRISKEDGLPAFQAELLDLPQQAASIPLVSVLPPHLAKVYSSTELLIVPPEGPPPVVKQRIPRQEYVRAIQRLLALCMVVLRPDSFVKARGALFAVSKSKGRLRLIADLRPWCHITSEPISLRLSMPHLIATRVRVPPQAELEACSGDAKDFFHCFALDSCLWPYAGLPSLSPDELNTLNVDSTVPLSPVLTTLPMGWKRSTHAAQEAHRHLILSDAFLRAHVHILDEDSPVITLGTTHAIIAIVYVDDFHLLYLRRSRELATRVFNRYRDVMESTGFALHKCIFPGSPDAHWPILGLRISRSGDFGAAPSRLRSLRNACLELARRPQVELWRLRELTGSLAWVLCVRRPLLAALNHVYTVTADESLSDHYRVRMSPALRKELRLVATVLPFAYVSLQMEPAAEVFATDASTGKGGEPGGFAVVATSKALPHSLEDIDAWAAATRWDELYRAPFKRPAHINGLEASALLAGARRALTNARHWSKRLSLLCDSQALIHATRKGRSSSPLFAHTLLQLAVLLAATGAALVPLYVNTEVMPADAGSRNHGRPWSEFHHERR